MSKATIPIRMTGACFGSIGDDGKFHKPRKKTIAKGIQWFIENEGYKKIVGFGEVRCLGNDIFECLVDVE